MKGPGGLQYKCLEIMHNTLNVMNNLHSYIGKYFRKSILIHVLYTVFLDDIEKKRNPMSVNI